LLVDVEVEVGCCCWKKMKTLLLVGLLLLSFVLLSPCREISSVPQDFVRYVHIVFMNHLDVGRDRFFLPNVHLELPFVLEGGIC
jgi:hypothetical protein